MHELVKIYSSYA